MREVLRYLCRMVPAWLLGLGLYFALRPARKRRLDAGGLVSAPRREYALMVFFMFVAGLLWLTVLPHIFWEGAGWSLSERAWATST